MGFTPDTIKQTLLGFISSQAAVSENIQLSRMRLLELERLLFQMLCLQRFHCKKIILKMNS